LGATLKSVHTNPQTTQKSLNVQMPNSKTMTSKEKLIFVASFIWLMHWGTRITDTVIRYALY
jgi:hypothetical protein